MADRASDISLGRKAAKMKTCEFCMYASDECFLLQEPIEYDSSGMTVKSNCPIRGNHDSLQIQSDERQTIRSESESDR